MVHSNSLTGGFSERSFSLDFLFQRMCFFSENLFFLQRILWISYWIKIRPSSHIFLHFYINLNLSGLRAESFSWRVTWGKCPWESFLKRKESVEQNAPEMVGECHPLEIGLSPKFLWTSPLLWSRSWYGQIGCRFSLLWSRSWCTMISWYGQIGCSQVLSFGVKLFAFSWKSGKVQNFAFKSKLTDSFPYILTKYGWI